MKIAVVDDGINNGYYNIGELIYDIEITSDLQVVERRCNHLYCNNHGTTCAAIIKKYCHKAEFVSIKILDDISGLCTTSQLIMAINWCVENGIKLINLSLGSTDYRDFESIRKCVNEAAKKGAVIIAAGSNKEVISYPAFLSNVIGVRQNSEMGQSKEYIMFDSPIDGIDCEASGEHCLINYRGNDDITSPSNSFSAPYITAVVAAILENNNMLNVAEIKVALKNSTLNCNADRCGYIAYRRIDWVQRALVFCFNKELDVSIYKQGVGFAADVLEIEAVENCFKYALSVLPSIQAFSEYDTIIIIDRETSYFSLRDYDLLVQMLEQLNINFVYIDKRKSLDAIVLLNEKPLAIKLWNQYIYGFGQVEKCNLPLQAPIIKVIDDGMGIHNIVASGLRKKFCRDGYFAISIAYSCEGIMFGSEYVFPTETNGIKYYLRKLYDIYKPDIIIFHYSSTDKEYNMYNQISDVDISIYVTDGGEQTDTMRSMEQQDNVIFYNHMKAKDNESIEVASQLDYLYEWVYNLLKA